MVKSKLQGLKKDSQDKKTKAFPKNAFQFCLSSNVFELTDIDAIAQAWNSSAQWISFNPLLSNNRVKREDYFFTVPDHLFHFIDRGDIPKYVVQSVKGGLPPIYYIHHHYCHAANSFFLFPFENAAVLTADWMEEIETLSRGICNGNDINILILNGWLLLLACSMQHLHRY